MSSAKWQPFFPEGDEFYNHYYSGLRLLKVSIFEVTLSKLLLASHSLLYLWTQCYAADPNMN